MNTRKRLERGFLQLSLIGYVVVGMGAALVLALGAAGIQTYRLQASEAAYDALVAAGKAQEEVHRKQVVADAKLKEAKDAEYKRRIAALTSRYDGVLKSRPSVLPPAEPADSVAGATLVCFQRDLVESAINGFVREAARIAFEGDQAAIGLDASRSWVAELLRRQ